MLAPATLLVVVIGLAGLGCGVAGLLGAFDRGGLICLVAGIAAFLGGLLGTVVGLVGAFAAVSSVDAAHKSEQLSKGIAAAMTSTAAGLVAGLVCIVVGAIALRSSSTHDRRDARPKAGRRPGPD